jgi:spore coat protein A, manganese oxidase
MSRTWRRHRRANRAGLTRREFIKTGAASGAGFYLMSRLGGRTRLFAQPLPGATIDPAAVQKYVTPLVIPPAMPRTAVLPMPGGRKSDYFEIAVRQFGQQILPPGLPQTTVWSYGSANHPGSFNYPAFTIEAHWRQATRVKWMNQLVDVNGNYLPHLLPIDQTLHWANPPGGPGGTDMEAFDPTPYRGPVPIVTHLHGGHSGQESDGFPEAWFLPAARNIPAGYATVGSYYDTFKAQAEALYGQPWSPGSRLPVRQRPGGGDPLVPRPHAGDDPFERLRRTGRVLSAPRRAQRRGHRSPSGSCARGRRPARPEVL